MALILFESSVYVRCLTSYLIYQNKDNHGQLCMVQIKNIIKLKCRSTGNILNFCDAFEGKKPCLISDAKKASLIGFFFSVL